MNGVTSPILSKQVVQNSWGSEWGENGSIRMVRGENESGIEFQAVAAFFDDKEGDSKEIMKYVDKTIVQA